MSRLHLIKSRLKHNPLGQNRKNKGIALLLAITTLMFMVYIASEVTRDSSVEYIVNSQELSRLKSYYAARNSMQIALLRIKLFQQASKLALPPGFANEIDQIWKFPFAWPLPVSGGTNAVDRDTMQKLTSESLMDASYTHSIEDEGSKIDVNDLASPSKTLQEITKKQLMNIFEQKLESDEEFRKDYQSVRFDELVNHIGDWMTDSNTSLSGQDKRSAFSELGRDYPPNRGFRTIEEIRLVPGMTEELFNLLSPHITIYGMKAINPNTATKEVLKSLDSGMTDAAVDAAIAFRSDPEKGPFKGEGDACINAFKAIVQNDARLTPEFDKTPMLCDKVINFRIKATGIYGSGSQAVMKTITAVVIDLNKSAAQIKGFLDKEKQAANPTPPATTPAGQQSSAANQEALPKGPPRVVYWTEN
ncbi:MAG: general secretion pathway protein GspK [Bdellovibrio sp.]|nr:general secretion pathway protein GspK [Bdellovibrio sp.]